jgi:hypothetical protein
MRALKEAVAPTVRKQSFEVMLLLGCELVLSMRG